jgi:hypothetical protein
MDTSIARSFYVYFPGTNLQPATLSKFTVLRFPADQPFTHKYNFFGRISLKCEIGWRTLHKKIVGKQIQNTYYILP